MQEALKAREAQEEVLSQTHSRLEADMRHLQQQAVQDKQEAVDLQKQLQVQKVLVSEAYSRLRQLKVTPSQVLMCHSTQTLCSGKLFSNAYMVTDVLLCHSEWRQVD